MIITLTTAVPKHFFRYARAAALLAGVITIFTIKTFADTPSPPAATAPATPSTQSQRTLHGWITADMQTGNRLRTLAMVILESDNNKMPADLGAFLQRLELTPKELDEIIPPSDSLSIVQQKAILFLPPLDNRELPELPDRKWINDNSPFIYEGNANISLKQIKEYAAIVILHERLDGPNAKKQTIVLAFLDGHAETVKREAAEKIIEESKTLLKKAEADSTPG